MANCDKSVSGMTPSEAYQCFVDADVWKQVAANGRRMVTDFNNTTIGEWAGAFLGFALLPAQAASYILPFVFLVRLVRRASGTPLQRATDAEKRRHMGWSVYMMIAGAVCAGIGNPDRFMLLQGGWEVAVGLVSLLLGPAWWYRGSGEMKKAPVSRGPSHLQ